MSKKIKIVLLFFTSILAFIIIREVLYKTVLADMQKGKVVKSFNENFDKFENVHNYLKENHNIYRCGKNKFSKKIEAYDFEYDNKGEYKKVEVKIEDSRVLEEMNFILNGLDFQYVESIGERTRFVFKDSLGCYMSICYNTEDMTKVEGWDVTKLKGNWYYLFVKTEEHSC